MTAPPRFLIRLSYGPSLAMNRLMCALGLWNQWDAVDEHVLIGAVPGRRHIRQLRDIGVTAIVNLCEEFDGHRAEMDVHGIEHLHLPTLDYHCPSADDLLRGLEFLQDRRARGARTLVHCKAGRGRSATLALCYVMAARDCSAADAYRFLRTRRPHLTRRLDRREPVLAVERAIRGKA